MSSKPRNPTGDAHDGITWPARPLVGVVESLFVGLPASRYAAKTNEESISVPVLSIGDITEGRIAPLEAIPRFSLRATDLGRFRLRAGDIVVSCRGTLLKAALVTATSSGVLASSNLITVRPDPRKYRPQLLLALFRTQAWQDTLKSRSRSSTGLMQLTIKDLADLPVPMPPPELQAKLAELVDVSERSHQAALAVAERRRALVDSLVTRSLLGSGHGRPQ